jgi:two-component system phosphate regulon response regulator PhoB
VEKAAAGTLGTVLVVEDDPSLRRMIVKHLENIGCKVHDVDNGEAALRFLEEHEQALPDLVCLDLALPAMSGFRVCEQIRAGQKTRALPVLVITARTSVQDHTFALEMGADAFLEKPFKLKDFEAEVRALIPVSEGASR